MKKLYEILGVPEGTEIEVKKVDSQGVNHWTCAVRDRGLSKIDKHDYFLIDGTSDDWVIQLLLGNYRWRIAQPEDKPEVKEILDAVRLFWPTASHIKKIKGSGFGDNSLWVYVGDVTFKTFPRAAIFRSLKFDEKYKVAPVENPWRRLKVVEEGDES